MRCIFFLYALFFSSRNDTIDMEPVKVKQVICFFISRELFKKLIIFSLHLLIYQLRYILNSLRQQKQLRKRLFPYLWGDSASRYVLVYA